MSDITGLTRKKSHSTVSISRRAKSAPSPADKADKKHSAEPPIVVEGEYNGSRITVYGEVHNLISNEFYENLNLRNKIIFVEHPSVQCDISTNNKKRLFNKLKGSEWVWYKYAARKLPVVCVDNRIAMGLLTSIEENKLLDIIDLLKAIELIVIAFDVLLQKDTKIMFVRENLTPIYMKGVNTINTQLETLVTTLSNSKKITKKKAEELMDLKNKIVRNIIKLSGILVDIHVKKQVEKYADGTKKQIVIFMGAGHAYRLHAFFPQIFKDIKYNLEDPDFKTDMEQIIYE